MQHMRGEGPFRRMASEQCRRVLRCLDAPQEFVRRSTRLVTRPRGLNDVVVLRGRRRVVGGRLVRRLVVRDPTGEGRMLRQGERVAATPEQVSDHELEERVDGRMDSTLVIT